MHFGRQALPLIIMASHARERHKTQRPIAVLIALAITLLYMPFLLLLFLGPNESVLDEGEVVDSVIDAVEMAVIIVSLAIAFGAIATRRQWGRWFVAAPIAYLVGALMWVNIFFVDVSPDDKMSLLIGACFFLSPLIIVVLLVSFGGSVKEYFATSPERGDAGSRT
jgi:hypothetical protein